MKTSLDQPTEAAAWIARGQQLEAQATPAALAGAVRSYDCAIAILRLHTSDRPATRQELAIACMNRGNALQKIGTPESLAAAVSAYDETIALFDAPAFETNFLARNSLGAAWMNRALALHRQVRGGTTTFTDIVRSHRTAIAVLQTLPLDESPWYRRNLSAAWMNLANALLDSNAPDRLAISADAARRALAVVRDAESSDPIAAELALKARRCLCDALGHQLSANELASVSHETTAAETSDTVDDALALIRHWTQAGGPDFRALTERFFRFGAHFYRIYQPHFLAEFVLETLDPPQSAGVIVGAPELYTIADEALALALEALRKSPVRIAGNLQENRVVQTSRALKACQARIGMLRGRA